MAFSKTNKGAQKRLLPWILCALCAVLVAVVLLFPHPENAPDTPPDIAVIEATDKVTETETSADADTETQTDAVIKTETETQTQIQTETETQTALSEDTETDYILNTNTMKFHYPGCGSVKKMAEKNKAAFHGARDELLSSGYTPCGNCKP